MGVGRVGRVVVWGWGEVKGGKGGWIEKER
jgi:hypothetical protein